MSVSVQLDEENNTYALGADIEGVFVPFVQYPADAVTARIAAVKANEQAAPAAPAAPGGIVSGNTGDDFNPADFTDNGDGTYTRTTDGATGRFTPSGFAPVTGP